LERCNIMQEFYIQILKYEPVYLQKYSNGFHTKRLKCELTNFRESLGEMAPLDNPSSFLEKTRDEIRAERENQIKELVASRPKNFFRYWFKKNKETFLAWAISLSFCAIFWSLYINLSTCFSAF